MAICPRYLYEYAFTRVPTMMGPRGQSSASLLTNLCTVHSTCTNSLETVKMPTPGRIAGGGSTTLSHPSRGRSVRTRMYGQSHDPSSNTAYQAHGCGVTPLSTCPRRRFRPRVVRLSTLSQYPFTLAGAFLRFRSSSQVSFSAG
jgi:hypothetical protein